MKVLTTVVTNYFSTTRGPLGRIENPNIVRELTIDQRFPTIFSFIKVLSFTTFIKIRVERWI